ncbi:MAG TPA: hypothetical protein VN962_05190 [Polyangia bacterium]|nr:hypothetical protein [Polyangia bacterium]
MRTARLSILTLAAGLATISGCSSSTGDGTGTGGANTGGSTATGGTTAGAGGVGTGGSRSSGTGGSSTTGTGGATATGGTLGTGGVVGTGGTASGGRTGATGGAAGSASGGNGGANAGGGHTGVGGGGGRAASGGAMGSGGRAGSSGGGTCTASKSAGASASGTGPHKVTVETNGDSGINQGTIFRPSDLGGTEKYPIFVWGEGGCSENGLSNSAAMGEIASHGYFVIADGVPNGSASRSMNSNDPASMGAPLLAYISWAIAENDKPCSAYYQSLDTTKIAANGFSCGGLMSEGTAGDPRITTWGLNSSGLLSANANYLKMVHTPVLVVLGGSGDIAYTNGERDYMTIAAEGVPIMLFSKDLGHGGDLFSSHGGDFTKIDLAWLNWQLKGDLTATGKGLLIGSSCPYCSDSAWEVKSMNIQ